MAPVPIILALAVLALLVSVPKSTGLDTIELRERRKKGRRNPGVVKFTVDAKGIVKEDPAMLARAAGLVIGRPVSLKEFALASMISSEEGSAPNNIKIAVAHVALNRAKQKSVPLVKLLLPDGKLAGQYVGYQTKRKYVKSRYVATKSPPSKVDLDIANLVLAGKVKDETGGAVQFDSPRVQRAVLAKKARMLREGRALSGPAAKTKKTPEVVAMARLREGKEMVTIPGVPADELRFWRPKAGVSGHDYVVGHDEIDILDDVVTDMYGVDAPVVSNVAIPKTIAVLADKWGNVFSVPPAWIEALTKIESSQIPSKVNLSDRNIKQGGAWGLLQITHTTAKDLAEWIARSRRKAVHDVLKDKWHGAPQDLLDPELNVMLAAYYLGRLRREFDDFGTVAAAYHQGPATVRKLLRTPKGLDRLKQYGKMYVAKAQKTLREAA